MENERSAIEIIKAQLSFPYYCEKIFPLSFDERYRRPSHWFRYGWAREMQENTHTAKLSARKHLKSTICYAYLSWRILKMTDRYEDWLYLSFKGDLAAYHTRNLKSIVKKNPYFSRLEDKVPTSPSIIDFEWPTGGGIRIDPAGILSFKRGRHPHGVVADDILADPTTTLNITTIDRVGRVFFEDVMSLPKEGGELHLVGTAQHPRDLFFQIKERSKKFKWGMYKAVINDQDRETLWPELFPYERLMEIRDQEIGVKAFNKEYLCSPVYTEDSYFSKARLARVVNRELRNEKGLETENDVYLGWDLGKKRHPSHVAIFEEIENRMIQRLSVWWDKKDYDWQLERIEVFIDAFGVTKGGYDDTRGELEILKERHKVPQHLEPVKFTEKNKHAMATLFDTYVSSNQIELINDQRQIDQILTVTNDLQAVETPEGHGDSFWSICLALNSRGRPFMVLEDEEGIVL